MNNENYIIVDGYQVVKSWIKGFDYIEPRSLLRISVIGLNRLLYIMGAENIRTFLDWYFS